MEIDLIYLWVDGSDPVWLAKKNSYLEAAGLSQKSDTTTESERAVAASDIDQLTDDQKEQVAGDCRFIDNDELRYSLRSVEMFAPWIRKIFIVTDGQCPKWLDRSNSRVQIIDHKDIMPHQNLPTFNSCAIEFCLWKIPGLSQCFLYGNDDMFFLESVQPSFFFNEQGHPYVRLKVQSLRRHLDRIYDFTVYSAQQEVLSRYGKNYTLAPHHCIDAYNLDSFKACIEEFSERVETTISHRFRKKDDLQRAILLYHAMANGEAHQIKISHFNHPKSPSDWLMALVGIKYFADSRCMPLDTPIKKLRSRIKKYNPKLICINDGGNRTDQSSRNMQKFMQELFPKPSQFELE